MDTARVWGSAIAVGLLLVVVLEACGDGDMVSREPKRPAEDFEAQATDFRNIHTMTPVRGFFIDNFLGHLDEAVAVANSPDGGEYPVGTLIQLVPQEAMVKRAKGFSPATGDWEFFFLSVSPEGTVIETRGAEEVVNRFGGNCASCHSLADDRVRLRLRADARLRPAPHRPRHHQRGAGGRPPPAGTVELGPGQPFHDRGEPFVLVVADDRRTTRPTRHGAAAAGRNTRRPCRRARRPTPAPRRDRARTRRAIASASPRRSSVMAHMK